MKPFFFTIMPNKEVVEERRLTSAIIPIVLNENSEEIFNLVKGFSGQIKVLKMIGSINIIYRLNS